MPFLFAHNIGRSIGRKEEVMVSYSDNDPKGWMGDPSRGAALGRLTIKGELGDGETLNVVRKQLDGDYDENGTYFGGGPGTQPLFWVSSEDGGIDYMIRAKDIGDARAQVGKQYPGAKIAGDSYDVSLDLDTLQQLLDGEVESFECDPNVVATVNDEIKTAAKEFETAVWRTLETWVSANLGLLELDGFEPDEDGLVTGSIVREMSSLRGGAGYLYYMEHEGAGVGTWDGDWDWLFKCNNDPGKPYRDSLRALSDVVKNATHTEHQKLKDALMNCALESVPEEDDEDEESPEHGMGGNHSNEREDFHSDG